MKKDLVIQKLVKIAKTQQILLKKLAEDSDFYGDYEVLDPEKAHEDFVYEFSKLLTSVSRLSPEEAKDIAELYAEGDSESCKYINTDIIFEKLIDGKKVIMIKLKHGTNKELHTLAIHSGFKKLNL